MIGGAEMYMPLCRECFNEKTKQQNLAIQILHQDDLSTHQHSESSEGDSTTVSIDAKFNNSNDSKDRNQKYR